jgi:hypothetical protein
MDQGKLTIGFILIFIGLMLALAATVPINTITNQFLLVSKRLAEYQIMVLAEIGAFIIFVIGLIIILKNK